MQRVQDGEEVIERVAAIDVGKAEVVVCIRIPDPARPDELLEMRDQVGSHVLVPLGGAACAGDLFATLRAQPPPAPGRP